MKHLITFLFILLIAGLLVSAAWLARPMLAELALERIQLKLKQRHTVELNVADLSLSGWSSATMQGVSLALTNKEPLFTAQAIQVKVAVLPLLQGRLKIEYFRIADARMVLLADSVTSNFLPLLQRKKQQNHDSLQRSVLELNVLLKRTLTILFDALPEELEVSKAIVQVDVKEIVGRLQMDSAYIRNGKLAAFIRTEEPGLSQTLYLDGVVNDAENTLTFLLCHHTNSSRVWVPFIRQISGGTLAFHSLEIGIDKVSDLSNAFRINGHIHLAGLLVEHRRISPEPVEVNQFRLRYATTFAGRYIRLDSGSVFDMNAIEVPVQVAVRVSSQPRITCALQSKPEDAQVFLEALPKALFPSLQGMQVGGTLRYKLYVDVDFAMLDSLKFSSSLSAQKLYIKKYGLAYIPKLNESFVYTTQDAPHRSFEIGPGNPSFTPLERISPHLKNSLITSEDASFFYHRGFNEDAFRKSIITNLRQRRFARGGSTITMQLVKNVFLNRKKTISRKLDETFLVWLIEHNRLVSKERMFEVYLNLIEWAPQVYGIGEAAAFYFNKAPSELTLQESIYLSSIVPKPKAFRYSFDASGNLKPYLKGYYRMLSSIMLRRSLITPDDTTALTPNVTLAGPARFQLILTDTVSTDSTLFEEEEEPTEVP